MSLVKEYFELTKKYQQEYGPHTLLLMQVGAFFECYGLKKTGNITGSQIQEFSTLCDLNIAEKGKDGVLMAGFSHYMIEKYLKKLQAAGYTVVVYTQDEQKSNTTRSLSAIYSPGTYFSTDVTNITNNTTCIWVNAVDNSSALLKKLSKRDGDTLVQVGIANIDIYTGKTAIFEFKETYVRNPTTFDELERFISIYKPSEAILIANLPDSEIDDILSYANIQCKTIHKIGLSESKSLADKVAHCEKQIYQREILEKFYKIHDYTAFSQKFYDNDNTISIQAFCYLLDFIYQHNPNLVNKIEEPCLENCSDRLLLANHSLKQLNIIDDGSYTGKFSSVEKMLNSCITNMGKRRFSHIFLNPTTNREYLQSEYNITEYMLTHFGEWSEFLSSHLHGIKDMGKIMRQIVMKKIAPKSLFQLHASLQTVRELFAKVVTDTRLMNYLSMGQKENISLFCNQIIQFLEKTLYLILCEDIETVQQFETNFIRSGVDTELDERIRLLAESQDQLEAIRHYFNQTIAKYEKKEKGATEYVKLHETEKNVFSLIATQRRTQILKQTTENKDIEIQYTSSIDKKERKIALPFSQDPITSSTQSGSNEYIVTAQIRQICKNISVTKVEMKDLLTQVYLKSVVQRMEAFQPQIEVIIEFVTALDVVYTKAAMAKKYNYCKPELDISPTSSRAFVKATGLRHCLIENIQKEEIYVVNDIELGTSNNGILLYGTNAVGKTSFIRAIGIAVLMAQAGFYVPCSRFEYAPYTAIFTRILGNDNIFKGLSTFAVEMSELRTILRLADENSLILGDELCSGTESISAKSIFVAGIEQLYKKRSSYIFATHLHEIVAYSEIQNMETLALKHMEVVYDREKDVLVYDRKLKPGAGNNMYGLEVCKSLSLPADFLEAAHAIRMKYNPESASLLSLHASHFNSQKLMKMCEQCGTTMGQEIHHIREQNEADADGFIRLPDGTVFHKNHPANLMSLCEGCHRNTHSGKKEPKETKETKEKKKAEKVEKVEKGKKKTDFSEFNLYT